MFVGGQVEFCKSDWFAIGLRISVATTTSTGQCHEEGGPLKEYLIVMRGSLSRNLAMSNCCTMGHKISMNLEMSMLTTTYNPAITFSFFIRAVGWPAEPKSRYVELVYKKTPNLGSTLNIDGDDGVEVSSLRSLAWEMLVGG